MPSDKKRLDLLTREPLVGMVLLGRLAINKQPCDGAETLRQALDVLLETKDAAMKATRQEKRT